MSDQGAWEAGLRQQIKRGIDLEAIKKRAMQWLKLDTPTLPDPTDLARNILALVAEVERLKAIEGEEDFSDVLYRASTAEAKIAAALAIEPFPRWGDSGHPVVWYDDLVNALTGLRE